MWACCAVRGSNPQDPNPECFVFGSRGFGVSGAPEVPRVEEPRALLAENPSCAGIAPDSGCSVGAFMGLGSPVVLFYPFCFWVPLLKPNSRKKGTLIIKGLLGNLGGVCEHLTP